MKKLKKSRWIFKFENKNNCAFFNAKNLNICFADNETKELIEYFKKPRRENEVIFLYDRKKQNKVKKMTKNLKKERILVSANKDEYLELLKWITMEKRKRRNQMGKKNKINAFRIVITEKCNMGCDYCFVREKNQNQLKDMNKKTLIESIELLAHLNKNQEIEIQFFGGEPLIKFQPIKEVVNYVNRLIERKKIKAVYYGITTNGTLITDEISRFFKKYNFLVSISMDGWEQIHNLNRHFLDKRGSYKKTVKGLKLLQKYKNDIGVLLTPAPNNISFLSETCKYIITKLKCNFLTINTPQPIKGNWDVDAKIFSNELKMCFKIANKYNATINSFASRVIYALNYKKTMVFSCSKFGNNYTATVSPEGTISPCIITWNYQNILSPPKKFINNKKFVNWKLTNPYYFKKCLKCPAMNVCGGPCPLEVYELKKFSKKIDYERCRFFKDFLEWAVWYEE